MSIKIAFDVSTLSGGHAVRGVGAYTKRLVQVLELESKRVKKQEIKVDFLDFKTGNWPCVARGYAGGTKLETGNYDVVHYPYFDLFFHTLPLRKPAKTVVTIHDVIPLVFHEHYPPGIKGKLKFQVQKFSLQGTSAVITDSENSKKDIVKYLSYPEEKIHVVYLAPGKEFKKLEIGNWKLEIKEKYQLPETFLLYVGDVNWNKNIPGLIRAFAQIQSGKARSCSAGHTTYLAKPDPAPRDNIQQRLKLVLVGKAFEDEGLEEIKKIVQLIKELDLGDRILKLGWVPEEDLVKIYNLASVYCQPSFYEGFGLPVLEAMVCGCPVVAANTSSLREICGESAMMVDPNDYNDITKGLDKVINDARIRETLIKKGLSQAKKFSWEKVAQETLGVYEKVAKEK